MTETLVTAALPRADHTAAAARQQAFDELGSRAFDLLVIGGGIVGAATAAEAARLGLAVALVDRGDFGGGTSSASSKLIHGGLRYLRLGDVRLVREAHRERLALMRVVAPHLVRPQRFLVPVYRGGPFHVPTIAAGLAMYSLLAGFADGRPRLLDADDSTLLVPPLRRDGLRRCGAYVDAQTDDARLCLENVRAASLAGATVVNYAEVVGFERVGGRVAAAEVRDALGGATATVRSRAFVNATGPWVDAVRRLEDPAVGPSVRLSKGTHVVVEAEQPWHAALTVPVDGVRVSFAIPWEGVLLLGTTDSPHEGDPETAAPAAGEVEQILDEARVALSLELGPERVLHAFSGLRVLPIGDDSDDSARLRREVVLERGSGGVLTVAGGKLTTHRRVAFGVLEALRRELGLGRLDTSARPLPAAADPGELGVVPELREHLVRRYGCFARDVLALAESRPGLLEPLVPGAHELVAEAVWAVEREWAVTVEDVLRRRTTLALRGLDSSAVRVAVATATGIG